ncbi:ABC transporter ATP-binding protein [Marispirochaeta sp.]|jgi:ATP-binding cassette, subfamily B, bacterial IrtB/YbtQ|uniref:ABC transporter ATP-binding protein n=1 Tax=Marispirochaeta sp. TaxID=2038653 RepID=UPI0029C95107|nr:ABC transporter ATP-binding protein [Marispirochaeta sp.]
MNIRSIMKAVTFGNTRRLRPMILWTMLEYFFRGAPYGILLAVVWELFSFLQHPENGLPAGHLALLSGGLLVSLIILYIVSRKSYMAVYYETYDLCEEGRLTIGDHLRKLSMGFFNARDPGNIGSYLINDYANVEFAFSHLVPQIFGALAMPLFLLAVLATQHWQLALTAALVIPAAVPFTWLSSFCISILGKKQQNTKMKASSRMLEYLQGMRLIKAFNLSGEKFDRLEKAFRQLKRDCIRLEAAGGPTILLSSFVLHSGLTLIILFGLTFLFAGSLPLPVYIMFLILGTRVYEPLIQALIFMGELNYYQIGVDRLEDLRKTPILTGSNPKITPTDYGIGFDNVGFRYHKTDVLKDISIQIPERSMTAFVGPSGSGKTTMTRLIARFWDVNEGSITLGGRDIREYDPEKLLAAVSMVFQDVYLFNDTVLNNICIGKPEASMEMVEKAARTARCHEFISALPEGYETMVGEGGCTLSGGEKQRISIARAILKDAPIVLLDEATASLDPENELYIQEAIDGLIREKTVVIIAHRLNTIVHADNVVVFNEGRIVQQGTHNELMNADGLYRQMWEEQQQTRNWKIIEHTTQETVIETLQ